MRIIYIHQYFKTPEEGGAIRSYYISQAMKKRGFEVEIISAHNKKKYLKKVIDGVTVHYLPVAYNNSFGFFKRISSYTAFVVRSIRLLKRLPEPNLLYISSTPLTVGYIGLWYQRKKEVPYFFEVRDLWPEAPIQMGYFKDPFSKTILRNFERNIYKYAQKIITLSPGMRDSVIKTAPSKAVHLVPNMSDVDFFQVKARPDDNTSSNLPFTISYIGAIGKVNHLEYFLTLAAASLQKGLKIRFLIAGDGAEKSRLQKLSTRQRLNNITFLGHLNKNGIRDLLSESDAVYISFKGLPILETNSPNKFFDALAAAKMCITNTRGWLSDLITKYQLGFYSDPDHPDHFIENIRPYLEQRSLAVKAGQNSRKLAENEFQVKKLTDRLCNLIESTPDIPANTESAYTLTH